jgi:hypothetical protein
LHHRNNTTTKHSPIVIMGKYDATKHPAVMLKLDQFKSKNDSTPPISSSLATCAVIVAVLVGTEMVMRIFFFNIKVSCL